MSSFDFPDPASGDRRPVTRRISAAAPRSRLVVTGRVVGCRTTRSNPTRSVIYTIDDGTGTVDLVFLGRPLVPGLRLGTRCTIEGTALAASRRLQVWNPRYRIESEGGTSLSGQGASGE